MQRQEEEAKVQRRQAARRRTRDILLERAKQRLLAATSKAIVVDALNPHAAQSSQKQSSTGGISGVKTGDDSRVCSAPGQGIGDEKGCGGDAEKEDNEARGGGVEAKIPLYAQDTWAARLNKVHALGGGFSKGGPIIYTSMPTARTDARLLPVCFVTECASLNSAGVTYFVV